MLNSRQRHYRLTLDDALGAHERALSFGGRQGVINLGSIESALARPYSGYYRSIHRKAAALVESVVRNHGFADGNKRTALILLNLLLERSGYRLRAAEGADRTIQEEVKDAILAVARNELAFADLVEWFRSRIAPV